ncbi:MAG: hypothetical protein B0W54_04670 [Cellvibrio sp. 79]|nr:MAG: hypothetical protein B0W54_04670 [Cellvibrio sp. 79]
MPAAGDIGFADTVAISIGSGGDEIVDVIGLQNNEFLQCINAYSSLPEVLLVLRKGNTEFFLCCWWAQQRKVQKKADY